MSQPIGKGSFDPAARRRLLGDLTSIAARAAAVILSQAHSAVTPELKADRSPVTAADSASEQVILESLARAAPGIAVIAEEATARGAGIKTEVDFFLVDPLDGTREFIAGSAEYTVNIALIHEGTPLLGVVAAPALGVAWRGIVGHGAERISFGSKTRGAPAQTIQTRKLPAEGMTALVSRSHLDTRSSAFLDRLPMKERIACGSALKFCRLAEGAADIYPRLAPTSAWDVAAGHAVIMAAGGTVTRPDGGLLRYELREGVIMPGFIAWGDPAAASRLAG